MLSGSIALFHVVLFREVLCCIWNQKRKLFHVPGMSVLLRYAISGNDSLHTFSKKYQYHEKIILLFFLKKEKKWKEEER